MRGAGPRPGGPAILLMDECLSNLDARLREKMAGELRRIQQSVGVTTVYVTHDQREAFALSDRVAVLHDGQIQQVARPAELYHRPRTPLAAETLGDINLFTPAEAGRLGLSIPSLQTLRGDRVLGIAGL